MNKIYKIFHPSIFQGSLSNKNYFEGWYFKHVSPDNKEAFAVIPGISLSDDKHSFVQFVDGTTGLSYYFRYSPESFHWENSRFLIRIGDSNFSSEGIQLHLENDSVKISGNIQYHNLVTLRPTLFRPGIMGWYSYVPGMECNHGVSSVNHFLEGRININDREMVFAGGKGYIEKDWGVSFPESWLWLQCNSFEKQDISVMISIAKIPWKGNYFIGFIAFMHLEGITHIFATYNRSKISSLRKIDASTTEVEIKKGSKTLRALIIKKESSSLKAPVLGLMSGNIKESINSEVNIEYSYKNTSVFKGTGTRAGYEETKKIFTYF